MGNVDYQNDVLNVLERIVYRGTPEDFMAVKEFYGDKRIRKEIVRTKCFGPKEVAFCCLMFKLKTTDFINYKKGLFIAYPKFEDCPDDFEYPNYAWAVFQGKS